MHQEGKSTKSRHDFSLLAECKSAVQEVVPDADLILYGSRARGDAQEDSDYDLLVLVDCELNMDIERAIVNQLFPVELRIGHVLTVLVYERTQWESSLFKVMPFHKSVMRDGLKV